jgi:hypothetical protein
MVNIRESVKSTKVLREESCHPVTMGRWAAVHNLEVNVETYVLLLIK